MLRKLCTVERWVTQTQTATLCGSLGSQESFRLHGKIWLAGERFGKVEWLLELKKKGRKSFGGSGSLRETVLRGREGIAWY